MDEEFDKVMRDGHMEDRTEEQIAHFNKTIAAEKKKLQNIFKSSEENIKKIAFPLIDNVAYMNVELANLKRYNIEHGIKEFYMNGKGQFGYKESVESKTYTAMLKNYMSAIKQLNELLPKGKSIPSDDGFETFGE